MAENSDAAPKADLSAEKDPQTKNDALINRMAKDNLFGTTQAQNDSLLGFEKAPDNALNRIGIATLGGLQKVPEGLYLSAKHNVTHPLQALETFGMGAGMAVVLKTVLPEGGMAGKVAAGLIGAYFTVEAAKPIYQGYQKAGNALTMRDLNDASTQIGHATGQFVVDTAIAATGYKVGAHYTGRALSSQAMDGFADAKANFYQGLDTKTRTLAASFGIGKGPGIVPELASAQATGSIEPRIKFLPSERTAPQGILKGDIDPSAPMEVSVMLKSKGSDLKMTRTLERISQGRQSPLTDVQIAEQFGATAESLNAVTKFAESNGLQVAEANLTSGRVVLKGNTGQFTEAFQTRLAQYEHASGVVFRGREGSLSVPKELTSHIIGILGMDDRPQMRNYHIRLAESLPPLEKANKFAGPAELPNAPEVPAKPPELPTGAKPPEAPTAPKPPEAPTPPQAPPKAAEPNARRGFMPNEVADAYNFPKESLGKGQAVGIIQLGGGFDPIDNARYYAEHGLPEPKVRVIETAGGKNTPGQPADGEVMLDSQVIGAVAPEATQHLIFAPNSEKGFADAILRATFPEAGEIQNSAISISWGMNEQGWSKQAVDGMSSAFKKALLKGISIFAASGDDGARDNATGGRLVTDYPASDPMVTGAGGTRLTVDGSGKINSEVVWNNNRPNDAGGGGISELFGPQDFQKDAKVPGHAQSGNPGRGVPDVAGNADPQTGYRIRVNGTENLTGGTSAVSPLYAALMMRINGALGKPFGKPLNPWLYEKMNSGIFNDITVGDNSGYKAGSGWDAATGLGSIDGTKMLNLMRGNSGLTQGLFTTRDFRYLGPTTVGGDSSQQTK